MTVLNKVTSALAVLTGGVHLFVGTFDTLYPALDPKLPLALSGPVIATWYILVFFIWSGWAFWHGTAQRKSLGLVWIAAAVIFVLIALTEGTRGLFILPQWSLLALTGGLAVFAKGRG